MACTLASAAGVPSGNAVTREATITSLGVAWESKVVVVQHVPYSELLLVAGDHCFGHSQRPRPACCKVLRCVSSYSQRLYRDRFFNHCSQDTPGFCKWFLGGFVFYFSLPAVAQAVAAASLGIKHTIWSRFWETSRCCRWFKGEVMLLLPVHQTAHLSAI